MGAAQSSRLADFLDSEDVPDTVEKLRAASIRAESDLKMLNAGEWLELGLSLGVRKRLQQKVGFAQPAAGAVPVRESMWCGLCGGAPGAVPTERIVATPCLSAAHTVCLMSHLSVCVSMCFENCVCQPI